MTPTGVERQCLALGTFGPTDGTVERSRVEVFEEVFQMTARSCEQHRKEVSPADLNQQYPHPGPGERKAFAGFCDVQGDPSSEAKVAGAAPEWA
jgi:hypothetical protein